MRTWMRCALAIAAAAAIAGTGCTPTPKQVKRSEQMLADAGFKQVPADNDERRAALHRLAPEQVTEVRRGDRMYYVYPDPKVCGCLYVGSPEEHDEYLRLVHQAGHPQPAPIPWNEGELGNSSANLNWELWGPWPWWD
jgi:hypothetical protein